MASDKSCWAGARIVRAGKGAVCYEVQEALYSCTLAGYDEEGWAGESSGGWSTRSRAGGERGRAGEQHPREGCSRTEGCFQWMFDSVAGPLRLFGVEDIGAGASFQQPRSISCRSVETTAFSAV